MVRAAFAFAALFWLAACSPPANPPAVLASEAPAEAAAELAWTLSAEGYGPIRIGMTAEEASAAFGSALVAHGEPHPEQCESYALEPGVEPQGMRFLSINGRLARITDHGSENFVTSEGIAVGDSAADVRVAYPDAIEEPAKDDGPPTRLRLGLRPPSAAFAFISAPKASWPASPLATRRSDCLKAARKRGASISQLALCFAAGHAPTTP